MTPAIYQKNMQRYKVSVVNYLNSKPFIYGFQKSEELQERIELVEEYPAQCAESLIQGKTDLALIPAAMILQLATPHISSSYCIGCVGKVQTVCLFSEVPIHEVTDVILDYQSRTSVRLFQILAHEYWKIQPDYHASSPGFESQIRNTTAAVVIGDRTIDLFDRFKYVYDLGETWQKHTDLPFVFAAWVSPYALDQNFLEIFEEACTTGMRSLEEIIEDLSEVNTPAFNLEDYYRKYISYDLDDKKREGLELFLHKVSELESWDYPEIVYQVENNNIVD